MQFTTEQLLLADAVLKRAIKLRHENAMASDDFKTALKQPIEPYLKMSLMDIQETALFIQQQRQNQTQA